MKIDLSMVGIFEDSELELDKKITFFLEKTELENRRLQRKLKKWLQITMFQSFRDLGK